MSPIHGFRHLLIPVDFSEEDEPLLELVLRAIDRPRVTLLHVVEALESEAEDDLDEFYGMLRTNAERRMAALVGRFRTAGFDVAEQVHVGRRAGEILRASAAGEFDLVVMRSRRVDPARLDEAWRAMAHQVTVLCPCPVLLLK